MLVCHACFLIKHGTHREEAVREVADSLLIQLRDRFPQVSVFRAGNFLAIPFHYSRLAGTKAVK